MTLNILSIGTVVDHLGQGLLFETLWYYKPCPQKCHISLLVPKDTYVYKKGVAVTKFDKNNLSSPCGNYGSQTNFQHS